MKAERTEGLEEQERTEGLTLVEEEMTARLNPHLLILFLSLSYLLIFQIFLDTMLVWYYELCPSEFLT